MYIEHMVESAFNNNIVFTLTQAMQLVGLAPSLFIVVFLTTLLRSNNQTLIPIFYFLSLACGFALPLLELYPTAEKNPWIHGGLLMGDSLLVAFGFLLICQFIMGKTPSFGYWLVLAIPLIGGANLLYADMMQISEPCAQKACTDTDSAKALYHIVSSSFIFLLLLVYFSRAKNINQEGIERKHKYWLIISLIILHLLLLAIDLLRVGGYVGQGQAQLSESLVRLTFIYLVITSLLRVFYPQMVREVIIKARIPEYDYTQDIPYVEKLKKLLETDKIYRETRLNRASLSQKLEISEHYLSRIINHHFSKNFNDLINSYRIDEAKELLKLDTMQQITLIGFEVGFNSIASFNRVFKEKTGLSPTEYRNYPINP